MTPSVIVVVVREPPSLEIVQVYVVPACQKLEGMAVPDDGVESQAIAPEPHAASAAGLVMMKSLAMPDTRCGAPKRSCSRSMPAGNPKKENWTIAGCVRKSAVTVPAGVRVAAISEVTSRAGACHRIIRPSSPSTAISPSFSMSTE